MVVVNHISYADPFTFGHFMYDNGYLPRFLTKDSLFRIPLLGRVVSGAQQIPVFRETADAGTRHHAAAVDAVQRGECVAIYPEGTLTRDPDLWPMRGKTGAARIALATGCPIIPVAQWGAQRILPPYRHWPRLLPRHCSRRAGPVPPVDLLPVQRAPGDRGGAGRGERPVMTDVTGLLDQIRGESAPARRLGPACSSR